MHIQTVDLQELFQNELPCPLLSSELVHIKPRRSYFFLSTSFSFQVAICAHMCIFSNWSSSYSGFMPLSLKVIHIINIYKALYEMQLIHPILTTALWVWNFCLYLTHGEKLKLSGCDLPKVTQLVSDKTGAGTRLLTPDPEIFLLHWATSLGSSPSKKCSWTLELPFQSGAWICRNLCPDW